MSRIRGFNTGIEKLVSEALLQRGLRFQTHIMSLPGRPDFVFPKSRLTVFVDGDFWHGYRYPEWKSRLPRRYWQAKIEQNRRRDRLNHQRLRRQGWHVMRLWGHEICRDLEGCIDRVVTTVLERSRARGELKR